MLNGQPNINCAFQPWSIGVSATFRCTICMPCNDTSPDYPLLAHTHAEHAQGRGRGGLNGGGGGSLEHTHVIPNVAIPPWKGSLPLAIQHQPAAEEPFIIIIIFLLKFQTPVTLCSGKLWSILLARLSHSADLRSRLRHVSSAPSVAYSTECSQVLVRIL